MGASEEIVRAARDCVGARFRPQGRSAASGLDCVGVVALAFAGRLRGAVPADYAQRGGSEAAIGKALARAGFQPVGIDQACAADLLLVATGPAQWHFAVLTDTGFVHADVRLRRVVESPGRPAWRVTGAWRIAEGEG